MPTTLHPLHALILCSAAPLAAQCTTVWSVASSQPDLTGSGRCSTSWDPDGAGPLPERLVIGGAELRGGNAPPDQRVMTWDGSEWQALGAGPGTNTGGRVDAFTVWNGMLVAGGTFTGGGVDRVALWNGSSWQPLGPGFPTAVTGLTVWSGELVAAGSTGGTIGVPVIRRWNGTTWTALPAPPLLEQVFTIVSFQGVLCVGGSRLTSPAGGVIERWNGTSWLPSVTASNTVTSLAVRAFSLTSQLYIGGLFMGIGSTPAHRIASTSSATGFVVAQVGNGLPFGCTHLHVRATSALGAAVVACLEDVAPASSAVMRLSGNTFVSMGLQRLRSVSYFGGVYHGATGAPGLVGCFRHDGTAWAPVLGSGLAHGGVVRALADTGDDVMVGGNFLVFAGAQMINIARRTGTAFQPVGNPPPGSGVRALLPLENGDVVAGGLVNNHVAHWNGGWWTPLGQGFDQQVHALCRMSNGDLIAGGAFTISGTNPCSRLARWDGSDWRGMGPAFDAPVLALAVRSDGTLFVGGEFTNPGNPCNRIAQWSGTAWLPLGSGCDGPVKGIAIRPNGDVVAVGAFTSAGGVAVDRCARWDGNAWSSLGGSSADNGSVQAVFALPNGDVIAGRGFHQPSTSPDAGISRWNGSTWSGIGSGLVASSPQDSVVVHAIAQRANGDLVIGGAFDVADGLFSPGLATLSTTCPAAAQPYGAGCSSIAGPLVITAAQLPWTASTFRAATSGIAPGSLCLGLIGFTQLAIPLQALLPQGQPGCTLLVSPDVAELLPQDASGVARSALTIPPSPSLVGAQFFQQSAVLEFTGLLTLAAFRSSNALALTIGTL